jgi:hypothetical protein
MAEEAEAGDVQARAREKEIVAELASTQVGAVPIDLSQESLFLR